MRPTGGSSRRAWCVGLTILVFGACVPVDNPSLRACAAYGGGKIMGSSGGRLRILPSLVPGVELIAASWNTYARTIDLGATEGIEYHTTLRSTRETPDTDVVLVHESRLSSGKPVLIADIHLMLNQLRELQELADDPALHQKDAPRDILFTAEGASGIATGIFSSAKTCPVAVRVVPRNLLPLYLNTATALEDSPDILFAKLRRSGVRTDTGAVRVRSVTHTPTGDFEIQSVTIENATDTVVTDMAVAIAFDARGRADTIEFPVRRLEPHQIISLATDAEYGSYAGTARTYPISTVRGREIADRAQRYLVSRMPRIDEVKILGLGTVTPGQPAYLLAFPLAKGQRLLHTGPIPVTWTLSSTDGRARIDTGKALHRRDSHGYATVRAEHATVAHVTATARGITGEGDIRFPEPYVVRVEDPPFVRGRRILRDGTVEVMNLCKIHPDGSVKYDDWFIPHMAEVRAESLDQSESAKKRRVGMTQILANCVRDATSLQRDSSATVPRATP